VIKIETGLRRAVTLATRLRLARGRQFKLNPILPLWSTRSRMIRNLGVIDREGTGQWGSTWSPSISLPVTKHASAVRRGKLDQSSAIKLLLATKGLRAEVLCEAPMTSPCGRPPDHLTAERNAGTTGPRPWPANRTLVGPRRAADVSARAAVQACAFQFASSLLDSRFSLKQCQPPFSEKHFSGSSWPWGVKRRSERA